MPASSDVKEKYWLVFIGVHEEPIRTEPEIYQKTDLTTWAMVKTDTREDAIDKAMEHPLCLTGTPYVIGTALLADWERGP